jgi:hypothetical protein
MGEVQKQLEDSSGEYRCTRRRVLQTFAGLGIAGASSFLLRDGYPRETAAASTAGGDGAVE